MPCVFRPCVACAIVAFIGVPVSAEVFTWTGNESTDFIDPLNWISDGGGVPGAGDQCVAHASSATTAYIDVDSGQHITIDSFIMNRANLQLRLRIGASLTIDPATASDPGLIVGRDGHSARLLLDCFSTPAPSSLVAPTIILGDDFGSLGRLEFNRAGEFHITQDLIVGRLGHGDIAHNHQFGGMPTVNAQRLSVAVGVFSDSTLLINDATWTVDDSVRLGIGGAARLELADATLSARELDLAVNATSVAGAEIVSASLTIDETARIGILGRSRVQMSGLSTMDVGHDLVLGALSDYFNPLVHGEGAIEMAGDADLLVGRDLWLSMLGDGDVLVEEAAAVSVDRDLRTVSASDATLHLRPSNVMTEPMVQIGGRADPITLVVEMIPTNDLAVGTSRTLLVAKGGIDGAAISVIDETIDGARRFNVTNDGFTVQIHVTAAADLNNDGVIDYADLLVLLGHWGACPNAPCLADLTGDGVIDFNDLLLVLDAWTE